MGVLEEYGINADEILAGVKSPSAPTIPDDLISSIAQKYSAPRAAARAPSEPVGATEQIEPVGVTAPPMQRAGPMRPLTIAAVAEAKSRFGPNIDGARSYLGDRGYDVSDAPQTYEQRPKRFPGAYDTPIIEQPTKYPFDTLYDLVDVERKDSEPIGVMAPAYGPRKPESIEMPETRITPLQRAPGTEVQAPLGRAIQRGVGTALSAVAGEETGRAELMQAEIDPAEGLEGEEEQRYLNRLRSGESVASELQVSPEDISRFGSVPIIPSSSPLARRAREMYGRDADERLKDLFVYIQRQNIGQRHKEARDIAARGRKIQSKADKIDPVWLRLDEIQDKIYRLENAPNTDTALLRGDLSLAIDMLGARTMMANDEKASRNAITLKKRAQQISEKQKPEKGLARIVDDTIEMLPAMGKGALLGAIPVVGPVLSQSMWAQQGMGSMYLDMLDRGASHETAKTVAIPAGILYAAIESAQVGQVLNTAKKSAVKRVLNESIKRRLGRLALEKGKDWGKEVGEEVLQGYIESSVTDAARYLEGEGLPTNKEMLDNIVNTTVETIKKAGPSLGILSGFGAGAGAVSVIGKGRRITPEAKKPAAPDIAPAPIVEGDFEGETEQEKMQRIFREEGVEAPILDAEQETGAEQKDVSPEQVIKATKRIPYVEGARKNKRVTISSLVDQVVADYEQKGKTANRDEIRDIVDIAARNQVTGIPSKAHKNEEMNRIREAKTDEVEMLDIEGDLDFFKRFNDTYSHEVGDKFLSDVIPDIQSFYEEAGFKFFHESGDEYSALALVPKERAGEMVEYAKQINEAIKEIEFQLPNGNWIPVSATLAASNEFKDADELRSAAKEKQGRGGFFVDSGLGNTYNIESVTGDSKKLEQIYEQAGLTSGKRPEKVEPGVPGEGQAIQELPKGVPSGEEITEKPKEKGPVEPAIAPGTPGGETGPAAFKAPEKSSVSGQTVEKPTDAQAEAGNYKMGHVSRSGLDISVENPVGSEREGVDLGGQRWKQKLTADYGYIRGTVGKDKDHIDVFIKPGSREKGSVFIVNQNVPGTAEFDEHKVMMGYDNAKEAKKAYMSNYESGWKGFGSMVEMPMDQFKEWSKNKTATSKPARETVSDIPARGYTGIMARVNTAGTFDFTAEFMDRERPAKRAAIKAEKQALKDNIDRLDALRSDRGLNQKEQQLYNRLSTYQKKLTSAGRSYTDARKKDTEKKEFDVRVYKKTGIPSNQFEKDLHSRLIETLDRTDPKTLSSFFEGEYGADEIEAGIKDIKANKVGNRAAIALRERLGTILLPKETNPAMAAELIENEAQRLAAPDVDEGENFVFEEAPEYGFPYFSPAIKTVENIKQEKGVVPQIKSMIKKGQFKKAEIEWTGLESYLDENPNATKSDILEYLRANAVEVEETRKGTAGRLKWEARQKKDGPAWWASSDLRYKIRKLQNNKYSLVVPGGINTLHDSLDDAKIEAQNVATLRGDGDETKYRQYILPGGKGYTETLYRVPTEGAEFDSPHWDETNVFAHSRQNDRETTDGESVRFLEEIQSDWAREAREKGTDVKKYKRQDVTETISEPNGATVVFNDGKEVFVDELDVAPDIEESAYIDRAIFDTNQKSGVPDFPHRKNWHEFVLRRALYDAARDGKDYLSWTTGEEQQDRYDLRKQIDEINVIRNDNDTYAVIAYDKEGSGHDIAPAASASELPGMIGKTLADRVVSDNIEKGESKAYKGEDLKVGGEWASNLYDKQIPNYLNKFAKKWGVKTQVIDINGIGKHLALRITEEMKQSIPSEGVSLFEPQKKYGKPDAEQIDMFDQANIETRSLTGKKKKKQQIPPRADTWTKADTRIIFGGEGKRRAAGAAVQKSIDRTRPSKRFSDVLGEEGKSSVPGDWKKNKRINLVGRTVKSIQEVAELFSVFRHPRAEHFQIVFVDRDGKVLAHNAYSDKTASSAPLSNKKDSDATIKHMDSQMRRLGAAEYYILHNHPSGNPTPSTADVRVTDILAKNVPGLRGHVVLDHDEYTVIEPYYGKRREQYKAPKPKFRDPNAPTVSGHHQIAEIGKSTFVDGNNTSVLVLDNQNRIVAWRVAPKKMSYRTVYDYVRAAGGNTAIVVTKDFKLARAWVEEVNRGRGTKYDTVLDVVGVYHGLYTSYKSTLIAGSGKPTKLLAGPMVPAKSPKVAGVWEDSADPIMVREEMAEYGADLKAPESFKKDLARSKAGEVVDLAKRLERDRRRLQTRLTHLSKDLVAQRAMIENEILKSQAEVSEKVKQAIYDYAKKIGIRGEQKNTVDTLIKNSVTSGQLRRAMDRLDEISERRARRRMVKVVQDKIVSERKRLAQQAGGQVQATVKAEQVKALQMYLDSLKAEQDPETEQKINNLLTYYTQYAGKDIKKGERKSFETLDQDVLDWLDDPKREVPDRARKIILKAVQPSLDQMNYKQLANVVATINNIKKAGRGILALERRRESAEQEELVEGIRKNILDSMKKRPKTAGEKALEDNYKSKVERRLKRVKDLGENLLYNVLDAERIIEGLSGFRPSKLKEVVWTPLWRASVEKMRNAKKAIRNFENIYRNIDIGKARSQPAITVKIKGIDKKTGKELNIEKEMTIEQMMAAYAYSQNPGGRNHLIGTGFTDEVIEEIIDKLPEQYKRVVDSQIDYYDNVMYPRINEVFKDIHQIDMPQEARYFPIMNLDTDRAEASILIDLMARHSAMAQSAQQGFTKSRVASRAPFSHLRYFDIVIRNLLQTEHYLAMEPAVRQVSKIIKDPQLRSAIRDKSPIAYQKIVEWINSLSLGRVGSSDHWYDKVADYLRHNFAAYVLAGKITSVLAQTGSLPKGLAFVNKRRFLASTAEFARHPIKFMSLVNRYSPFMEDRMRSYERELAEQFEEKSSRMLTGTQGLKDRATEALMWVMGAYDKLIASILWHAKYTDVVNKTMDDQAAIDAADEVIRKTQSGGGLITLPSLYRGPGFVRSFSMFKSDPNKTLNLLYELVHKIKQQSPGKSIEQIVWIFMVAPLVTYIMRHGFRMPWEDPEEATKEVVRNITEGVPIVGQLIEAGSNYGLDNLKKVRGGKVDSRWRNYIADMEIPPLSAVTRGIEGVAKGDPETMFDAFTMLVGLPYSQVRRTIRGGKKVQETGDFRYLVWSSGALEDTRPNANMSAKLTKSGFEERWKLLDWYTGLTPEKKREFKEFAAQRRGTDINDINRLLRKQRGLFVAYRIYINKSKREADKDLEKGYIDQKEHDEKIKALNKKLEKHSELIQKLAGGI